MQAIQGIYDNGEFKLEKQIPVKKAKVIILFPEESFIKEEAMSTEEALRILEKYKGSIKGNFDVRNERDEYFNEKYGIVN